jgi:hypothetical protein
MTPAAVARQIHPLGVGIGSKPRVHNHATTGERLRVGDESVNLDGRGMLANRYFETRSCTISFLAPSAYAAPQVRRASADEGSHA